MQEKTEIFRELYKDEAFHRNLFKRLAESEKDPTVKQTLQKLEDVEYEHAQTWKSVCSSRGLPKIKDIEQSQVSMFMLLKQILGLELTVKIIEHTELSTERKLGRDRSKLNLTQKEKAVIKKMEQSDAKKENPLKQKLLGYSPILQNIRSVIFGMNDGLVEILGAVAGFAAAIQNPTIVLVAGFIVAISGTLSMAGGAYLSIEYDQSVNKGKEKESSKAAAIYTGFAYIFGAAFPLIPFIFGFNGWFAIGLSILLTAIVLTFASIIISVVSDTSITKRVVRTLMISLGIVAITILLGLYARTVLHISV